MRSSVGPEGFHPDTAGHLGKTGKMQTSAFDKAAVLHLTQELARRLTIVKPSFEDTTWKDLGDPTSWLS